jgi:parallel beta-helix repeat protein
MRLVLTLGVVLVGLAANASAVDTCPILGPDTVKCQQGIGRAGGIYAKLKLKAVQRCLNRIQTGELTGDPVTVCRGTPGVPPTDPDTLNKLASAENRVTNLLAGKCSDPIVLALDLCAATVAGLGTCLIDDSFAKIDAAIAEEYGTVAPSGNAGEQDCQAKIAKEGAKYLNARAKAIARCIDNRNKRTCGTDDPVPNCLAPSEDGPSAEKTAAKKIAKAEAKLRDKLADECSDPEITALDACADTGTPLADCLVCSHDNAAALLVADQYDAVRSATPTGPSLQSIADAANDGDTIFLEPGTYLGQTMTLKDSNLSVIGIKTCDTDTRPLIENDPMDPKSNGIISCGSLIGGCTDIADNLLFQSIEVNDFEANDILTNGAEGVTYRDVITRGPGTNPGTEYGIFPIFSNNVLVEDSVVSDVRDAGIYVGQSTNIIIRNNEVFGNVAGIEVENSANAEVYGNYAHDNSGGLLVFKLVLPTQFSNCHNIHDNILVNNNGPNYGSGLVGDVPVGTGLLILSNDSSVFENNTVTGNDTFGIVLTDQVVLDALFGSFPVKSPDYLAEYNMFVGNTVSDNGTSPDPVVPDLFTGNGAIVIENAAPGNTGVGNCGDPVPRYCSNNPAMACTTAAECGGPPNTCKGNYLWNGMPDCPVPPAPPGCPFIPPTTTTSTTGTTTTTSTTIAAAFTAIHATFVTRCAGCHAWSNPDCNVSYGTLVGAPSSQTALDFVEPGDSTLSYLMHKLDNTQGTVPGGAGTQQMPLGGPYYNQGDRDQIRSWIDNGALNDCAP